MILLAVSSHSDFDCALNQR